MTALYITLAALVLLVNTVCTFVCMTPLTLCKLILPFAPVRRWCDRWLMAIATGWIRVNCRWMDAINHTQWQVQGTEGLQRQGWYLVLANHQSWVDILVLQYVLGRRIPFLKFFIKRELIFVPIIGLAWWALDFPFMRRKGGRSAQQDLQTARDACAKFRLNPTSIMSFVEGTRFTAAKHAQQQSPWRHLLKPKSGGVGVAIETLGEQITAVLDVTIIYPDGVPTFVDLMAGRLRRVQVDIQTLTVPADVLPAQLGAAVNRAALQDWLQQRWDAKDARLSAVLEPPTDVA